MGLVTDRSHTHGHNHTVYLEQLKLIAEPFTSHAEGLPVPTSILPPGVQVGPEPMKTGQGSRQPQLCTVEGAEA